MKLVLTVEVEHDLLDIPALLFALPPALDSVRRATSAGIAETGPQGIQIQVPGTNALARVRFRLDYRETVERLPARSEPAATDAAGPQ